MNRRIAGIALVVVAIVAFPAILFAEDISLDTVATWVEEIAFEQDRQSERLDEIEERLEMVEDRLYLYDAEANEGGNCQLAVGETQWNDMEGGMHPYTMAAYLLLSDGQIPKKIEIESVSVTPEGFTAIKLATYQDQGVGAFNQYGAYVVEHWDGCEFQGRSRFWEKDYSDNVTFLD